MFTELVNKIINEHKKTLREGAITTQGEADNYIELIKQSISSVASNVPMWNSSGPFFDEKDIKKVCSIYASVINNKLISGINEFGFVSFIIKPKIMKEGGIAYYNHVTNKIQINPISFLYNEKTGFLKTLEEINFNKMKLALEHELIHFHQYSRRKILFQFKAPKDILKKYDKNKNNRIDPDEYAELSKNSVDSIKFDLFYDIKNSEKNFKKYREVYLKKDEIAPDMDYVTFSQNVDYFNNPVELNTWAFDESKNFIEYIYNYIKTKTRNYSSEQMKQIFLRLLHKKDDFNRFFTGRVFYKYLTTDNKKKFFKYVYQILLNMDYPPLIVNK
jgi:hypothetical protein